MPARFATKDQPMIFQNHDVLAGGGGDTFRSDARRSSNHSEMVLSAMLLSTPLPYSPGRAMSSRPA